MILATLQLTRYLLTVRVKYIPLQRRTDLSCTNEESV